MVKRLLCTTALESTWGRDEPVLFLGEWCRRFSRAERWTRLDAEVAPYHWDDRRRLEDDYRYLLAFHERLLPEVGQALDEVHGTHHSTRYWRILIGPWLGHFCQLLFDRWTSIQEAAARYELSGTVVLRAGPSQRATNDMAGFIERSVEDDWNHLVYADIAQSYSAICCRPGLEAPALQRPATLEGTPGFRAVLRSALALVARGLAGDQDAFTIATYLPLREELRLHWRLRQVPQLWRSAPTPSWPVESRLREWRLGGRSHSLFEECARSLVPRYLPAAYLEGYAALRGEGERLGWPASPNVIFTSNGHIADDVFKAWAAERVEHGTPLVIGQHGGHYGVSRLSFIEAHEEAASDLYMSWGWSEPGRPKIVPVGQLKVTRPLRIRHGTRPDAVLVTVSHPRQSYFLFSGMLARQWLDYFADQCTFVRALPERIRRALRVRLYTPDYGWDQALRWRAEFPELRLDDGRGSLLPLLARSRVYISTYNATTFLESLAMDIPTLIYWNPAHWELRESAVPYFESLKRAGVFHETPQSAAGKLTDIWDDVESWWRSSAVVDAVSAMRQRYCRTPPDLASEVAAALTRAAFARADGAGR